MREVDEPTQEVISPSVSIISLELSLRFHLANDLLGNASSKGDDIDTSFLDDLL